MNKKCKKIMWVGLSNKDNTPPLDQNTLSGKLIQEIEMEIENADSHKTNLVKFAPKNKQNKLRYPNSQEMNESYESFLNEIQQIKPSIIILLGKKVSDFLSKKFSITFKNFNDVYCYEPINRDNIFYISIHHPSYIQVYKRKNKDNYKNGVLRIINELLL